MTKQELDELFSFSVLDANLTGVANAIERGVDVNIIVEEGRDETALIYSVVEIYWCRTLRGKLEIVTKEDKTKTYYEIIDILLDNMAELGLDVNKKDIEGKTAFDYSCMYGEVEVLKLFLKHMDRIGFLDVNWYSILGAMNSKDGLRGAKFLVDNADKFKLIVPEDIKKLLAK